MKNYYGHISWNIFFAIFLIILSYWNSWAKFKNKWYTSFYRPCLVVNCTTPVLNVTSKPYIVDTAHSAGSTSGHVVHHEGRCPEWCGVNWEPTQICHAYLSGKYVIYFKLCYQINWHYVFQFSQRKLLLFPLCIFQLCSVNFLWLSWFYKNSVVASNAS